MTNQPLDELYLIWLYGEIGDATIRPGRRTHWNLARKLFTTEFVWFVPNDDNRAEDGRELRLEFLYDAEIPELDPDWYGMGCSYLELLVALSRRLAFETDGNASDWFWHMIRNLELIQYNDSYKGSFDFLEEVTDRITFRTYEANGQGGLFPLRHADKDQTKTEIWYQLSAYLIENAL